MKDAGPGEKVIRQLRDPSPGRAVLLNATHRVAHQATLLALHIASVFEPLSETAQTVRERVRRCGVEEPDDRHRRLLRTRDERPGGCRAAEQRDELAPFQLTKLHALTPAKVTAYWIGEHQVRGLPPCGISVRPMTVQGQSEPKGAAKYNRFRAGMAGKQTRNQCMMFRNSWQGSAKADPSPLALFGRPSFVDPN
jgi:hypothetical protein